MVPRRETRSTDQIGDRVSRPGPTRGSGGRANLALPATVGQRRLTPDLATPHKCHRSRTRLFRSPALHHDTNCVLPTHLFGYCMLLTHGALSCLREFVYVSGDPR